ncbi:MAG: hypothetical protein GY953_11205, partial [bacterium]|nr:hypothetical protein [bacterium]
LRGTALDPLGRTGPRRQERALIRWYRETLEPLLDSLDASTLDLAVEIAGAPDRIRGYEDVKTRSVHQVQAEVREKLENAAHQPAA